MSETEHGKNDKNGQYQTGRAMAKKYYKALERVEYLTKEIESLKEDNKELQGIIDEYFTVNINFDAEISRLKNDNELLNIRLKLNHGTGVKELKEQLKVWESGERSC